jgi:hypothetical protein
MNTVQNKDINLYVRNAKHVKLNSKKYDNGLYSLDVLKGNILTGAEVNNVDYISIPDDKKYYPACIAAAGKDFDGAVIGTQNNKPWCNPFKSRNRNSNSGPKSSLQRGAWSMVYLKNPSMLDYSQW